MSTVAGSRARAIARPCGRTGSRHVEESRYRARATGLHVTDETLVNPGIRDDLATSRWPEERFAVDTRALEDRILQRLIGGHHTPVRLGRYELQRKLGQGACGEVYEARDPELDRRVAIKVLRIDHGRPRAHQDVARMRREAKAVAQIDHPHVVRIYDVSPSDPSDPDAGLFIVMELVDGLNLRQWLRQADRTPAEILEVFVQAGEGLAAAHREGLVHRDFKPTNVMISTEGRAVVVDFGLARLEPGPMPEPTLLPALGGVTRREGTTERAPVTEVGTVVGTPAYMAPECLVGFLASAASDQYSFFVSLHEALFGARPRDASPDACFVDLSLDEIPTRRGVTRRVRSAIVRGNRVAADQRFATMDDAIAAIRPRASRRRIALAVSTVATVAASAVVALAAVTPATTELGCPWSTQAASARWDEVTRGAVAEEVGARVVAQVDDYVARWTSAAERACTSSSGVPGAVVSSGPEGTGGIDAIAMAEGHLACLDDELNHLGAYIEILGEQRDLSALERATVATWLAGRANPHDCLRDNVTTSTLEREQYVEILGGILEAQRLRQRGEPARALEHLEALAHRWQRSERASLLIATQALWAAVESERIDSAEALMSRLRDLTAGAPSRSTRVDALLALAWYRLSTGAAQNATDLLEMARASIDPNEEPLRAAMLEHESLRLSSSKDEPIDFPRVEQALDVTSAILGPVHPRTLYFEEFLALVLVAGGHGERARERLHERWSRAEAVYGPADPRVVALATTLADTELATEDFGAARRRLEDLEAKHASGEIELTRSRQAMLYSSLGFACKLDGDPEQALRWFDTERDLRQQSSDPPSWSLVHVLTRAARIECGLGRAEAAAERLRQARRVASRVDNDPQRAHGLVDEAREYCEQGDER